MVQAQESTLRARAFEWIQDTIALDSLPVEPGSVYISELSESEYTVLDARSLVVVNVPKTSDSLHVTYRVFLFDWNREWYFRDSSEVSKSIRGLQNPFKMTADRPQTSTMSGLDKQGSISRGIQTGNAQNLSVQSELNLRLQGRVSKNLSIEAVISDQNIPVQPNGNTQVLQDFDQVYMRLFTPEWSLIGGDFNIQSQPSSFMKYSKRLRGIGFDAKHGLLGAQTNTRLSGAISRGKFARNLIAGVEGTQGPYRLTGSEGEAFIVVLSGTERVFLDGQQLERGQDRDYIIDYNRAEIVFTSKHLITKDRRIIVEFQYSSDAFARSLFQVGQSFKANEKLNIRYDVYSEQDNPNSPLLQDLNDEQISYLSTIGSDLNLAFGPSAREANYSETEVLYRLVEDSLGLDSVFVYSTNADSQLYRVVFTPVQPGIGDYQEVMSTANGRVFEVVPRVNGVPQGNYVAAIRLITPKKRQMAMVGADWQLNERHQIKAEGAISNQDVNLFAQETQSNETGGAIEVGWKLNRAAGDTNLRLIGSLNQQFVDGDFRFIERFRSVEFQRDWRLQLDDENYDQWLTKASVGLAQARNIANYELQRFGVGSFYEAYRHNGLIDWKSGKNKINYKGFLTNGQREASPFQFYQHRSVVEREIGSWVLGYKDYVEHSKVDAADSITPSYRFAEWEVFVRTSDTLVNSFRFAAGRRTDNDRFDEEWRRSTTADQAQFDYQNKQNRSFQWGLRGRYRRLDVSDSSSYIGEDDEHFTGRLNYTARLWKGSVISNAFVEYGSGREERYSFVYVEVPAGQGQYTWIDYNDDGVAQQDEFEIAQFQNEANFIRVVLPSNTFVTTNNADFSQSLLLNPVSWKNKKGVRGILSRFSNQSNFRLGEKWYRDADWSFAKWLSPDMSDTSLVSVAQSLQNSLLFNRGGRYFNAEYITKRTKAKQLQTSGSTYNTSRSDGLIARYSIKLHWRLEGEVGREETTTGSDYLIDRNYDIYTEYLRFGLFFVDPGAWDVRLRYQYKNKEANDEDLSGLIMQKVSLNVVKQAVGKASYQFELAAIDNDYRPTTNGSLSYALLEGLTPGFNLTWQSTITTTLAKSLQLSLGYSGRYSNLSGVIHNGSLQARLFF